jgi:hypothetical protein
MSTKGELCMLFGPSACVSGELVSFVLLYSFAGGVEPFFAPLEEPVVCELCVWELLCSICIAFLCAFSCIWQAYAT